jgi:DNA gyrase/topoisomerase IV subunit A
VQDPESVTEVKTHRGVKQRVDLGDVRRHLEIAQQVMADPAELPYHVLLAINGEGKLAVTGADEIAFGDAPSDEQRVWMDDDSLGLRSALLTSTGEAQVLLATDMFKLILTPAKSILVASRFGAKGLDDLLRLEPGESLTAMALWNPARTNRRFVCAITRQAHIRRFESDLLALQLGQAPYFKLEKKRQSAPAHLVQADGEDQLILGTSLGRLTRIPVGDLGIIAYRGFKPQKGEEVTSATSASPGSAWVAVDSRGHVFHFRCDTVPAASAEGKKSQTLQRGMGIVGFASRAELTEKQVYALTAQGWVHALALPSAHKPPKLTSMPRATLPLAENDQVVALLCCDAPFGDVRSSSGGI